MRGNAEVTQMTTMKMMRRLAATLGLAIVLALPAGARAHGGGDPRDVGLHVGSAHDSCYFDLHPELTRRQFRQFAAEGGQILRFRQVSAADTLGAGSFDVDVGYAYFFLDDAKGAWNNTMSHPQSDHYLGEQLGVPYLTLRLGLTDRVDGEVFGSLNPQSNYGFLGFASKIRILDENHGAPVSLAVRPSASALLGPSEVQAYNVATDLSVSRRFHGIAPFAGVTLSTTAVVDSSPDTDVGHQSATRAVAFAGVDYQWKFLSVGAQAEISALPALALRAGGRF